MAKFYNNRVKTGKLAGSVFAIRNGETIERAYQPVVANPNTAAQIASRAKMKLLSQLSAVMAPFIAIPREGAISSRNLFVRKNYPATSFTSNNADVDLLGISLTKSVVSIPGISVTRTVNDLTMAMSADAPSLSRVVYAAFIITESNELRNIGSAVATTPGADNRFETTLTIEGTGQSGRQIVVYAYGLRDNTEAATVAFSDVKVVNAQSVARVIATRTLTNTDVTVTETVSTIVAPPSQG